MRAASFFGASSTLPSRNCYCDADVLERLMAAEELADLSSTDFFDSCGCGPASSSNVGLHLACESSR